MEQIHYFYKAFKLISEHEIICWDFNYTAQLQQRFIGIFFFRLSFRLLSFMNNDCQRLYRHFSATHRHSFCLQITILLADLIDKLSVEIGYISWITLRIRMNSNNPTSISTLC